MKTFCLGLMLTMPVILIAQAPAVALAADPPAPTVPSAGQPALLSTTTLAPLTARQKIRYRTLRLVEPITLLTSAASAGLDQWRHSPSDWQEGSEGYAIRFASAQGYIAAESGSALILDLAFHLDPRYHRLPQGTFKARLWNAVSQSFLAYKDSGGRTFNIAEVGGNIAAGFINGTWEPPGYRGSDDALMRGGLGILYHTGRNVVREFIPDLLHPWRH